ncbi:MAG: glycosyltransferase family 4 protein [Planctomycetota bacterium]|jgi:glycosyltransferase involved in cell wall biosynthesis
MKILTLNYEYPPVGGGGATVTAQLCEHLVAQGHQVDVVTMRYKDLPHEETVNGVRIVRVPSWRQRGDVCRMPEMATYLVGAKRTALNMARKNNYDIIHAHFIIPTSPLVAWLSRKTGIPYLVTCHGSDVPGHNPQRFVWMHKLIFPYWKQLAQKADMLVSPSDTLKHLIQHHTPQTEVAVIPNGFDVTSFDGTTKKQQSILLCSRLLEFKGFQYVIDAVKELTLSWHVHIVGEGPYRQTLENLAEGSQTPITFHGWLDRDDPKFKQLYETSAIFVFPSEMENFPTVLLEAMSAGCAIITSTAGGCPEVVGDAALLIEPKNTDAIRKTLQTLIDNPDKRNQLITRGLNRVRQFTWDTICSRYLNLYEQLIGNQ